MDTLRLELERTIDTTNRGNGSSRTIRADDGSGSIVPTDQEVLQQTAAANSGLTREVVLKDKKVEDLRRKVEHVEEQNRVLSRALIKEVGDGATMEEAVDEGCVSV